MIGQPATGAWPTRNSVANLQPTGSRSAFAPQLIVEGGSSPLGLGRTLPGRRRGRRRGSWLGRRGTLRGLLGVVQRGLHLGQVAAVSGEVTRLQGGLSLAVVGLRLLQVPLHSGARRRAETAARRGAARGGLAG